MLKDTPLISDTDDVTFSELQSSGFSTLFILSNIHLEDKVQN